MAETEEEEEADRTPMQTQLCLNNVSNRSDGPRHVRVGVRLDCKRGCASKEDDYAAHKGSSLAFL
eukprot:4348197-Amphidinium_carterae.1